MTADRLQAAVKIDALHIKKDTTQEFRSVSINTVNTFVSVPTAK